MDQKTARWMQIVWMDQDDLEGLHAREKLLATRLPGSENKLRFVVENRPHWQDLQRIALTTSRLSPNGFWPVGMDENAKWKSVAEFERAIFPIWMGIEERDKENEDKMSNEEISAQRVLLECLTLHRQDVAIHTSMIKPNRFDGDHKRMADLHRRALKASGG